MEEAQVLVRIPADMHARFKAKLALKKRSMREQIQIWIEKDLENFHAAAE